ncbi:uncharacterized protein LOC132375261 isoform X2 [Balaenoptera ricei]|uniref:uncharacterized protein LOC132375261 isoform X2 n=1 Tax=Balaenoptera ricei TaxID=2746895 RepID=UPI0028BE3E99|nr:uncharacterized protein LOC132375261 isoform X2 [Balaenoptera ricei]
MALRTGGVKLKFCIRRHCSMNDREGEGVTRANIPTRTRRLSCRRTNLGRFALRLGKIRRRRVVSHRLSLGSQLSPWTADGCRPSEGRGWGRQRGSPAQTPPPPHVLRGAERHIPEQPQPLASTPLASRQQPPPRVLLTVGAEGSTSSQPSQPCAGSSADGSSDTAPERVIISIQDCKQTLPSCALNSAESARRCFHPAPVDASQAGVQLPLRGPEGCRERMTHICVQGACQSVPRLPSGTDCEIHSSGLPWQSSG